MTDITDMPEPEVTPEMLKRGLWALEGLGGFGFGPYRSVEEIYRAMVPVNVGMLMAGTTHWIEGPTDEELVSNVYKAMRKVMEHQLLTPMQSQPSEEDTGSP